MDRRGVKLKDGLSINILPYVVGDFEKLVAMYESLSEETLRYGPPPYTWKFIARWTQDLENIVLVAKQQDKIVGNCNILMSKEPRYQGIGEFFIYIHQDYQDKGLGTAMITKTIQLAKEREVYRIELTVVADNQRALHMYKKLGFEKEGALRETYYEKD